MKPAKKSNDGKHLAPKGNKAAWSCKDKEVKEEKACTLAEVQVDDRVKEKGAKEQPEQEAKREPATDSTDSKLANTSKNKGCSLHADEEKTLGKGAEQRRRSSRLSEEVKDVKITPEVKIVKEDLGEHEPIEKYVKEAQGQSCPSKVTAQLKSKKKQPADEPLPDEFTPSVKIDISPQLGGRRSKRLRAVSRSTEARRRHCRTPPPRLPADPTGMDEAGGHRRFSWEVAEERALQAAIQRSLKTEELIASRKNRKKKPQLEEEPKSFSVLKRQKTGHEQKDSSILEPSAMVEAPSTSVPSTRPAKKKSQLQEQHASRKEAGSSSEGEEEKGALQARTRPKRSGKKIDESLQKHGFVHRKRGGTVVERAPSHWVRRSQREPGLDQQETPRFQELLELLEKDSQEVAVLKLKDFFGAHANPSTITAVLHALERNTSCQVLYLQNFNKGMLAPQLLHLVEVLKEGYIWSLNLGENWQIPEIIWDKFAEGLKETNVTNLYVSESAISPKLKIKMRDIIRQNRKKHDRHKSIDNLDVIERFVSVGGCMPQA